MFTNLFCDLRNFFEKTEHETQIGERSTMWFVSDLLWFLFAVSVLCIGGLGPNSFLFYKRVWDFGIFIL